MANQSNNNSNSNQGNRLNQIGWLNLEFTTKSGTVVSFRFGKQLFDNQSLDRKLVEFAQRAPDGSFELPPMKGTVRLMTAKTQADELTAEELGLELTEAVVTEPAPAQAPPAQVQAQPAPVVQEDDIPF